MLFVRDFRAGHIDCYQNVAVFPDEIVGQGIDRTAVSKNAIVKLQRFEENWY